MLLNTFKTILKTENLQLYATRSICLSQTQFHNPDHIPTKLKRKKIENLIGRPKVAPTEKNGLPGQVVPLRLRPVDSWEPLYPRTQESHTVVWEEEPPVLVERINPPNYMPEHLNWQSAKYKLFFHHYIYKELPKDESYNKFLKVLLIKAVEGVGAPLDIVEVPKNEARNDLLIPRLAVYPTKENVEKYTKLLSKGEHYIPSSPFVHMTMRRIESILFTIRMNMEEEWQIEPWHVRIAFTRMGLLVPEDVIILPPEPINGPDLNIQGKEILVKIKLNNKETCNARVRIHHVPTEIRNQLDVPDDYYSRRAIPLLESQAEELDRLNNNDPKILYMEPEEEIFE